MTRRFHKKTITSALVTLFVIVLGVVIFALKHHNQKVRQIAVNDGGTATATSNVPGGNTGTSQTTPGTNTPVNGVSNSKDSDSNTPGQVPSSDTQPAKPIGNFVSNHRATQSAPNEVSTCTTTAGVTCQISFTSGNITKSLPAQKTDASGNTSWNWTLQQIGITKGTWKITARAINGSKITTATDTNDLVVE